MSASKSRQEIEEIFEREVGASLEGALLLQVVKLNAWRLRSERHAGLSGIVYVVIDDLLYMDVRGQGPTEMPGCLASDAAEFDQFEAYSIVPWAEEAEPPMERIDRERHEAIEVAGAADDASVDPSAEVVPPATFPADDATVGTWSDWATERGLEIDKKLNKGDLIASIKAQAAPEE